jgi:hypothetical protein
MPWQRARRGAAEEAYRQRAMQRAEAEMVELTPRERCGLANLCRCEFWGPPRTRGVGISGAGGGAGTSSGQ